MNTEKNSNFFGSDAMIIMVLNLLIVVGVIVAALDEQGII